MCEMRKRVAAAAVDLGYEFVREGRHNKWQHTVTGAIVFTSKTPSCERAMRNAISDLRKGARHVQ